MNTITRRNLLRTTALVPVAALAACNGQGGFTLPTIPVSVSLPPGVNTFIGNINDIFAKIDSLGSAVGTEITTLEGQAKGLLGQISGGGNASSLGSSLLSILGGIAPLLPPPYGTVATAILTLIPVLAGLVGGAVPSVAAHFRPRVPMTVNEAWQIIYGR